ncbi:MAG: hypothetical protein N2320_05360 [Candidatus Bipolaricaulota bacterium]|nr:hypothetical protein [Candidatus Bipolaricaulota bacterium]
MVRWIVAMALGLGLGAGLEGAPGAQPAPGSDPAWEDRVYVATSPDGLVWFPGALLADRASVPEVIYTSRGEFWAYWVDFSQPSGPSTSRIGVARSPDGARWEKLGVATFSGLEAFVPVDPDVVELPDGRIRMYFLGSPVPPGGNTVYSAISTDGLHFVLEPGPRFRAPEIFDPSVVRLPDGRYRMYLNQNGDITSATSSDGLRFIADPGVRIPRGGVPGAIVLPDGTVRLYACTDGISAYRSADGVWFTLEKPRVVPVPPAGGIVCDPSVCAGPAGYLMVYKHRPRAASAAPTEGSCAGEDPGAPAPGMSGIRNHHGYRAVSVDGRMSVGEASPVLRSASVPDAVVRSALSEDGKAFWCSFSRLGRS